MLGVCAAAMIAAAAAGSAFAQETIAPASATPGSGPMPDVLQKYTPVTAERLRKPEDANWLLFRRTYDGWGYSPLSQITPANVGRLQLVWSFATGQVEGHQAPPIVNNGVMFVATPGNQVLAIEAKTGNEKWVTKVAEYKNGYYTSIMPLIADGKVMLGTSGGELGVRGFVAAYDAETGKEAWRTFMVPEPGQPGSETWPQGDHWKTGGGSVWVPGTYDPETNLAFWGTGNGGPWMGDQRPGDNLYTSSTVAIDVATGRIKGHHQYHPNDSWDWDEVSPPILVDYVRGGRTIKGLIDVARDGYLWFLERTDGRINFVEGKPYVKQNVFRSLDPKTGRPEINPERKPGTGKMADFCPSLWGGKNWPPVAFSPKTRMIYIPANENLCTRSIGRGVQYTPGRNFTGATTTFSIAAGADHVGEVQAWNVDT